MCNEPVEFDSIIKQRQGASATPLPAITKSLWTSAVESVVEYCRVIWDIYPDGDRLINFARCNDSASTLLKWSEETQSMQALMKALIPCSKDVQEMSRGIIKRNPHAENVEIISGCRTAVETLALLTAAQIKAKENIKLVNRGRIVCLTQFKNESQIQAVQEKLALFIEEHNSKVNSDQSSESKLLHTVDFVELVLVHTHPINEAGLLPKTISSFTRQVSPHVFSEIHSTPSGTCLAQKMISLVLKHYSLASTTVTGIPMKEEQNASSSANYDVEIVHPKDVHVDLYKSGLAETIKTPKEGCEYETIPLKWCTPRSTSVELHFSTAAVRLTPVDVNSRPSSCLTNFLLSGRTVMLEMPRSKSSKIMSHMLSSHNNELYIHTLAASRSILEDPPSISEGTGGRVTDYRINDFAEFMKKNKLVRSYDDPLAPPAERSIQYLERQTLYWPIIIGNTIMFNLQSQLQRLIELVPKECLTVDEVNECKTAIYQIVNMESKANPLPVPTGLNFKGKGPKREELYKLLYKEIAHFVKAYAGSSSEHQLVLSCLNDLFGSTSGDSVIDAHPNGRLLCFTVVRALHFAHQFVSLLQVK